MELGKRCDEIVRLIDETLRDVAVQSNGASDPEADRPEPEFPEDEPGRVQAHEQLCVVGRLVRGTDRKAATPTATDA
jgi:hypothetical protein